MSSLCSEELSPEVAGFVVGFATLAGLAKLELGVRRKEALMVGRAAESFFASGL